MERLQLRLGQIEHSRGSYERATRDVGIPIPRTEEEYAAAQSHAKAFLAGYPRRNSACGRPSGMPRCGTAS